MNQDDNPDFFELAKIGFEEGAKFSSAVGVLFLKWAETEYCIYKTLLSYAKINNEIGRALLSGTRARALMNMIKNVAVNTKVSKDRIEDLNFVFAQLGAINTMRDMIAHHAHTSYSWPDPQSPEYRLISDLFRVSKLEKGNTFIIGSTDVDAMLLDLSKAQKHLGAHEASGADFSPAPGSGDISTWHYKSLQPVSVKELHQRTTRKPFRQRKSSRQK